jgi:hypothetical protein
MNWLQSFLKLISSQWWTENWATAALNVVIFLLALIVVVRLGLMSWNANWRYVDGRTLLISQFNSALAPDIGLGFSALVRDAMRRLSVSDEDIRIDLASRWADPVTISSDLASVVPQGSIVSGLVQLLTSITPTHDRTLNGSLQTSSPRGPGVTASLEWRSGGIFDTVTIWQDELPTAQASASPTQWTVGSQPADMVAFYPFAFAIAVWAAQRLDPTGFARLGTNSWESYVAFSAGDRAQRAGMFASARDLYLKALALDSNNQPGRFSLGVVELRLARGARPTP